MKILKRNIKLFYIISFLEACIFTTSIWVFFFTSYLIFSFHTALIITILSWVVAFIFEVPSWAWADRFWRKKMYFLGISLIILSFSFWLFSKDLYLFIFSAILNWLWFAITSWNFEALIHDSLEEKLEWNKFKKIWANAYISIFSWRTFSSLFAWYLFVINPLLPIYFTILAYIIVFIILFFIVDVWQKKSHSLDTKTHIKEWLDFLSKNRFLFYLIIIISLISSIWNIYWFTYQPYFKQIWFSIESIWILFSITGIFSALWAHFIKKMQDVFTEKKIIFIMIWLLFISWISIQFFNIYLAILWVAIISIVFGFVMSFWNNVLIQKSPKTHKSTILSIFSFVITIWYVIFSIISWFIVDYCWIYELYLWNIILIILLFIFSISKLKNETLQKN